MASWKLVLQARVYHFFRLIFHLLLEKAPAFAGASLYPLGYAGGFLIRNMQILF
jgi:hypothetical protein